MAQYDDMIEIWNNLFVPLQVEIKILKSKKYKLIKHKELLARKEMALHNLLYYFTEQCREIKRDLISNNMLQKEIEVSDKKYRISLDSLQRLAVNQIG